MESLAPPLACALEVRLAIQNGTTAVEGVNEFIRTHPSIFAERVQQLLLLVHQDKVQLQIQHLAPTPLQRSLFNLIVRSMRGDPIGSALNALIEEMRVTSENQMEEFAQKLPTQLMLPVLLLQFPAFLILLLGPLIDDFTKSLAQ